MELNLQSDDNLFNLTDKNIRMSSQIKFILKLDELKGIIRKNYLISGHRKENSAEHSWHIALMVAILSEYSDQSINIFRALKMALIHDIIEIIAGDTFCYDSSKNIKIKIESEENAANELFALLPEDQQQDMLDLWHDFEKKESPEAKFVSALDGLMPLFHNYFSNGKTWKEYNLKYPQVKTKNKNIVDSSKKLNDLCNAILKDSIKNNMLDENGE